MPLVFAQALGIFVAVNLISLAANPRDSIHRNKKENESPLTGYVAFADSLLAPNSHQMAYATNGIFLLEYMHDS